MHPLLIIIWIWVICFLINLWWLKINPEFVDEFYMDFEIFTFEVYKIILYFAVFVGAPMISTIIIWGEVKTFFILLPRRVKLFFKAIKIKDRELRWDYIKRVFE
jgi:hypothetical protein